MFFAYPGYHFSYAESIACGEQLNLIGPLNEPSATNHSSEPSHLLPDDRLKEVTDLLMADHTVVAKVTRRVFVGYDAYWHLDKHRSLVSKMLDSCSTFIRRPAPVVNSANEPDIAAILTCDAKKVWRRVWTVLRLT